MEPDIGPRCRTGLPRVDDDQLGARVQGNGERLSFVAIGVGHYHVVAPDHDALRQVFVVGDGVCPARDDARRYARSIAEVTGGEHAGRAEEVGEPGTGGLILPASAIAEDDGLRALLLPVSPYPFGDRVERLIPGDALPLSAPFRAPRVVPDR